MHRKNSTIDIYLRRPDNTRMAVYWCLRILSPEVLQEVRDYPFDSCFTDLVDRMFPSIRETGVLEEGAVLLALIGGFKVVGPTPTALLLDHLRRFLLAVVPTGTIGKKTIDGDHYVTVDNEIRIRFLFNQLDQEARRTDDSNHVYPYDIDTAIHYAMCMLDPNALEKIRDCENETDCRHVAAAMQEDFDGLGILNESVREEIGSELSINEAAAVLTWHLREYLRQLSSLGSQLDVKPHQDGIWLFADGKAVEQL